MFLSSTPLNVYLSFRSQIVGLIAKKTLIKISAKYTNFADVFFPDLAPIFPEYTEINNHAIKLINSQ